MKVAIAGYAMEGRVNYDYWASQGHEMTIADQRELTTDEVPEGAEVICGDDAFTKLADFDLVVRTASLAPSKLTVRPGALWSATNEFFARCPADIIGVTGTKGKGTTSSMIAAILSAAGKTVHLVGNIGIPALELLPQIKQGDIVVFELSSFQLWDIQKSPRVAVVLLIEADHLNVHHDMDDYVAAKANIRRYQLDDGLCVYHPTNSLSEQVARSSSKGSSVRYAVADDGGVYEKDGYFMHGEQTICSTDALQLIGRHNVENACAAITAALHYSIDSRHIETGLRAFKGLPHRLELVRTLDDVAYYNDSFSSAPSATIAAIRSFEQPEILILGGTDKGADFKELVGALQQQSNIKKILLIGEIRQKLQALLDAAGLTDITQALSVTTMQEVVGSARDIAIPGDVVVLSPACASFDMFRDFYDRGDQFRSVVEAL